MSLDTTIPVSRLSLNGVTIPMASSPSSQLVTVAYESASQFHTLLRSLIDSNKPFVVYAKPINNSITGTETYVNFSFEDPTGSTTETSSVTLFTANNIYGFHFSNVTSTGSITLSMANDEAEGISIVLSSSNCKVATNNVMFSSSRGNLICRETPLTDLGESYYQETLSVSYYE